MQRIFLKIPIKGTNLIVNAHAPAGLVSIPTFSKPITIPQARQLGEAVKQCAKFVFDYSGRGAGKGRETQWVMFAGDDKQVVRRKMLLHNNDMLYITARRAKKLWGAWGAAMVTIDQFFVDPTTLEITERFPDTYMQFGAATAIQAAHSIMMVADRCQNWLSLD